MKILNKKVLSATIGLLMMSALPLQQAQADDDFKVISVGSVKVGDNGSARNPRLFYVNLPRNLVRSSLTRNRAILQYKVQNVEDGHNEIYINPTSQVCTRNNRDIHQSRSIGIIEDYDADADMKDDYFSEFKTIRSSLLRTGRNTIMICARNSGGGVSGGLDDFYVREMAIHYKTR